MRQFIPLPILDRWFRIAVVVKGLDGAAEVLGGLALVALPLERLKGLVADLATREIAEDRHAFIAQFVLNLDQHVDPHGQVFAVLYLLGHGAIKLFLAGALLRRHYHLYPYAMAFLLAFIVYQSYRIGYSHSVVLSCLTALDVVITWLTYLEWQRHRRGAV